MVQSTLADQVCIWEAWCQVGVCACPGPHDCSAACYRALRHLGGCRNRWGTGDSGDRGRGGGGPASFLRGCRVGWPRLPQHLPPCLITVGHGNCRGHRQLPGASWGWWWLRGPRSGLLEQGSLLALQDPFIHQPHPSPASRGHTAGRGRGRTVSWCHPSRAHESVRGSYLMCPQRSS